MTKLPQMDRSRPPTNWGEDHLLKRLPDARGHARSIRAPGGWIARFDKDGKNWETIAMGFRNTYDMAFNIDGELSSPTTQIWNGTPALPGIAPPASITLPAVRTLAGERVRESGRNGIPTAFPPLMG